MTEPLLFLIVFIVSTAAVAGLAALIRWLLLRSSSGRSQPAPAPSPSTTGGTGAGPAPTLQEVERALIPFAYAGICAAYRISEWAMDEVGERLHGVDKQSVANAIYDLLPARIGKFDISTVKHLVPPARFAQLVQRVFDRLDATFTRSHTRYEALFRQFTEELKGES